MLSSLMTKIRAATIETRFAGPGLAAAVTDASEDTVMVALTHGRLGPGPRRGFDRHTRTVFENLTHQPGYVGGAIRRELFGRQVWTMTAWTGEAFLVEFVRSTHHREAIRQSGRLFAHTRFLRIEVPRRELPLTWAQALGWLAEDATTGV